MLAGQEPFMRSSRPPQGASPPAALPALLRATHLFGLALGSALGKLRDSGTTAARMFERVEESALLLRMAREAAEILGARWDKVPERHPEPASTRLAGCVSDVDRWLCELLAGAQVAPGYDALVAATFGASIPFSIRTSFNSGREWVRKGRSGERGNPNQLRHLCRHSDTVRDSGEAQPRKSFCQKGLYARNPATVIAGLVLTANRCLVSGIASVAPHSVGYTNHVLCFENGDSTRSQAETASE